jgi:hypothetical protein
MSSTISSQIYKEIINLDYQITNIIVYLFNNKKIITLEIFFEKDSELFDFTEYLFKKNLPLNSDPHEKSITVSLHTYANTLTNTLTNTNKTYWDYILTELFYPSNTNSMIFKIDKEISNPDELIKLTNIPEKLSQLSIESTVPVDLTNLPGSLRLLDLSQSRCSFNLDYLPESLQILYLPRVVDYRSCVYYYINKHNKYKYYYTPEQLSNLPTGLNCIYLNHIRFDSVNNLIHNFDDKIKFLTN